MYVMEIENIFLVSKMKLLVMVVNDLWMSSKKKFYGSKIFFISFKENVFNFFFLDKI